MTVPQLEDFLAQEFPQMLVGGKTYFIEAASYATARIRMQYADKHLRPGGTISGPSMFALADYALYVAVLASIGPVALAVTTNLNINFIAKPAQRDLIGECHLFKIGKRLAVGEVSIHSDGMTEMVAHATGTYSIPPR
ncbi:MAG: PaaI family thioesterase [Beijerinckiaceae bacterium]